MNEYCGYDHTSQEQSFICKNCGMYIPAPKPAAPERDKESGEQVKRQHEIANALLKYLGVSWHRVGNSLSVHLYDPFKVQSLHPASVEYTAHFEMDKAWGKVEQLYNDYVTLQERVEKLEQELEDLRECGEKALEAFHLEMARSDKAELSLSQWKASLTRCIKDRDKFLGDADRLKQALSTLRSSFAERAERAAQGILAYSVATGADLDEDDVPNIKDHILKEFPVAEMEKEQK